MNEAYAGLPITYQLQPNEFIRKGYYNQGKKALDKTEENAKIVWHYDSRLLQSSVEGWVCGTLGLCVCR